MSDTFRALEIKFQRYNLLITFAALVLSLLSLILTLWPQLVPGKISPLKPSGVALVRGVGPFPSDHLVIPFEWKSTSSQEDVIRDVVLVLWEVDDNGERADKKIIFVMQGEYPDMSYESFAGYYKSVVHTHSFSVKPHAVTRKVLVFHNDEWWDEESPLYNFRFVGGEKYEVDVRYQRGATEYVEASLFEFPVYDSVDEMGAKGESDWWWDYWEVQD